MKQSWFILIWAILFYSCKEVSFPAPQPAGVAALKEIPVALRGKYQTAENEEKKDTLFIESWGYHFKDSNDKDWLGRGVLSDSLVVKFYQRHYFVNFRSGNQWVLRIIKPNEKGDFSFLAIDVNDEEKRNEILKKLSKRFKVTEISSKDETYYQINPTPDQLMQLVKEGYFTGTVMNKIK